MTDPSLAMASNRSLFNIGAPLDQRSRFFLTLLCYGIIGVLGVIDFEVGSELSLAIFYIIPVFWVAWFAGKRAGLLISAVATGIWFLAGVRPRITDQHPVIVFWNTAMVLIVLSFSSYLLSALRSALEKEKELARTDELTGAANRRFFLEAANAEYNRARRFNRPFTIAYFDIDNFKTVNDQFGHHTGDRLLRGVGETILRNIREIDLVARLGGDEFAILLPETHADAGEMVIQKIRSSLLKTMEENRWPATFSIGVVTSMSPRCPLEEILRIADGLMYESKNLGKNRIRRTVLEVPAGGSGETRRTESTTSS